MKGAQLSGKCQHGSVINGNEVSPNKSTAMTEPTCCKAVLTEGMCLPPLVVVVLVSCVSGWTGLKLTSSTDIGC